MASSTSSSPVDCGTGVATVGTADGAAGVCVVIDRGAARGRDALAGADSQEEGSNGDSRGSAKSVLSFALESSLC